MSAENGLTRDQNFWRAKILTSSFLAYAAFYLVRKVFGICKTSMALPIEEGGFGFDYNDLANIWALYLLAYMLGQFINSFIGRKWGPRVLLLGGLGQSIAINIVFGYTNSYYTFMVFMFFNGLVQAAGWPGSVGAVSEWLRAKERGTIMGIWSTSYVIGNITVKLVGGFLLGHYSVKYGAEYGIRYSFLGCTLLAFAIWWVIYFWQRNRPEDVGLEPIVTDADRQGKSVKASNEVDISIKEYMVLLSHPVVLMMGTSYFCIKFLRYALDSWLPTFLSLKGMGVDNAAYYSSIFDWTGLAGAVVAGLAMDRLFKGRWEIICLLMGFGLILGYLAVLQWGANPIMLAVCFGLVGFMLYGPDTLLCGAGTIVVAGERNAIALAGLVNGIGSIGPVIQEKVIGWLLTDQPPEVAIRNSNLLGLSMSVLYVFLMIIICIMISIRLKTHNKPKTK